MEQSTALTRVTGETQDLAAIPDADFRRALERIEISKARMNQILHSHLVEGAHFGNPNNAFKKPILMRAGAEELRKAFRLQLLKEQDDRIVESAEYVSVTVYMAICDISGRILDRKSASCSTKEKRFKSRDGSGYIYEDARECLHDCRAMAEKRCEVLLVRGAMGLTAFLASEEEMEKDLADGAGTSKPTGGSSGKPAFVNQNGPRMRFGSTKGKLLGELETKELESALRWAKEKGKFLQDGVPEMEEELERRRFASEPSGDGNEPPPPTDADAPAGELPLQGERPKRSTSAQAAGH